jgi:hypothetical protein
VNIKVSLNLEIYSTSCLTVFVLFYYAEFWFFNLQLIILTMYYSEFIFVSSKSEISSGDPAVTFYYIAE